MISDVLSGLERSGDLTAISVSSPLR